MYKDEQYYNVAIIKYLEYSCGGELFSLRKKPTTR